MQSLPRSVPNDGIERHDQVKTIFSEIAPRYDLLNHLLSLNMDRSWRRLAVDQIGWEAESSGSFLDACTGTFDLALELGDRPGFRGRIIATDFACPMMVQGARKIVAGPITPVCGDSLALPFPNDNFDGAMVGFGVRNLSDLECGLRELYRVLKRGKLLVVLEFALPPNPFVRMAYLLYFRRVLPVVGRIISGHPWAYRYLPESVEEFPGPDELGLLFKKVGFEDVGWTLLTGGIAAIHWGKA